MTNQEVEPTPMIPFQPVTSVNPSGELLVNGGKFARAQIIMAYEMMGGPATFAEWAMNNKGDFYTKMFTKVIGREIEAPQGDDPVEAYLKILDLEPEEVTPDNAPPELVQFTADNLIGAKLAVAAKLYADGEELAD